MKLLQILLIFVFFFLAGVSFYYTNMEKKSKKVTTPTNTQTEEPIYVYREYGDVSYTDTADAIPRIVGDSKMVIAHYSSVKTGDGRAYIIFPDNSSITLSSSTEIEIRYESSKIAITQVLGSTYHRVSTRALGTTYEVRTKNTLAVVHGTKLAVIYDPIIQRTYVAVTENNVEVTGTYDNGTMNKAPVMVQEGSFAHVQSPIVSSKNASSTENLLGTVTVGKNEEVPEIKEFISKNSTLDVRYDAAPLVGKKEFIEKAIDSLKEEAPKELPTEVTIKTFNEPNKKEPVASKAVPTLTSTASPYDTPSKKTAAVLVSSSSETQPPASGGGGFTVVPVEVVTKQLKSFTLNDTLSQEEQSFSDAFYTTYEQLYFVDDPITYCKRLGQMSAKSMVSSLTTITEQAGYILPKQDELVSFATDLVAACADESMNNKAQNFKIRFDTAYPY